MLAGISSTPFLNARASLAALPTSRAAACPHGSSGDASRARVAARGVAVINGYTCLSFQGMRCEVCYRAFLPANRRGHPHDYRPREGMPFTRCSRPR